MKNLFLLILAAFIFCSCSDESALNCTNSNVALKTSASIEKVNAVNLQLDSLFNSKKMQKYGTRATAIDQINSEELTENTQRILTPMVPTGANIRDEIINAANNGSINVSPTEINQLQNLGDAELAELAYFTTVITNPGKPVNIDGSPTYLTRADLTTCLGVAIGIGSISDITGILDGTYTVMTAETAFAIAKGFFFRTLGWVGVAYSVYKFGNCVHARHSCVYSIVIPDTRPKATAFTDSTSSQLPH